MRSGAIMPSDPDLPSLAHSVLRKKRDCARDSRGTPAEKVSQPPPSLGTAKIVENQDDNLGVPLSQALGHETAGQHEKLGTVLGTVAGQSPYSATVAAFKSECPAAVETGRWRKRSRTPPLSLLDGTHKPMRSAGRTRAIRPAHRARATRS